MNEFEQKYGSIENYEWTRTGLDSFCTTATNATNEGLAREVITAKIDRNKEVHFNVDQYNQWGNVCNWLSVDGGPIYNFTGKDGNTLTSEETIKVFWDEKNRPEEGKKQDFTDLRNALTIAYVSGRADSWDIKSYYINDKKLKPETMYKFAAEEIYDVKDGTVRSIAEAGNMYGVYISKEKMLDNYEDRSERFKALSDMGNDFKVIEKMKDMARGDRCAEECFDLFTEDYLNYGLKDAVVQAKSDGVTVDSWLKAERLSSLDRKMDSVKKSISGKDLRIDDELIDNATNAEIAWGELYPSANQIHEFIENLANWDTFKNMDHSIANERLASHLSTIADSDKYISQLKHSPNKVKSRLEEFQKDSVYNREEDSYAYVTGATAGALKDIRGKAKEIVRELGGDRRENVKEKTNFER